LSKLGKRSVSEHWLGYEIFKFLDFSNRDLHEVIFPFAKKIPLDPPFSKGELPNAVLLFYNTLSRN